jgi:hypothetical protein
MPKGSGELIFDDGSVTPSQLVLKLFLDSKRPASSNFTTGKIKKSNRARSGE